MNAICLASVQPSHRIESELARWFQRGAELAATGTDCFDLDIFVHDRRQVPDSRAATTVLTGYYAQKERQRLF